MGGNGGGGNGDIREIPNIRVKDVERKGDVSWTNGIGDLLQTLEGSGGSTMNMPIQAVAVPLFDDEQGGLRVTGTRVLLERIVHAFEDGATPEGIVQSYDTLQLADVYAVLTWYLRHKAEVEDYLRRRAQEAEAIRRTIEAKQPDRAELRARLMARRAQKEAVHAPPAQ